LLITMKRNYLQFLTFVFAVIIFTGCADSMYKSGNKYYNDLAYSKAAEQYEKALKKKNIPDARFKLADCYRKMNNSVKAEENYAIAVTLPEAQAIHKFYYAQQLMKNGKCEEAKKWLSENQSENIFSQVAKNMMASCDQQAAMKRDSAKYVVQQLNLSTPGSEFSPVKYKDGIVFTGEKSNVSKGKFSPYTGRPYYSLYYVKKDNNKWGKAEPLSQVENAKFHNTSATFSADGNTMFYTASNMAGKKMMNSSGGIVNFSVLKATLQNNKWQNGEMLPFTSKDYSTGHPSLSADGTTMYFASDMPGGMGGSDIYMVKYESGAWGTPVNLGPTVNTAGNEMFPVISGNTLYYSSDGIVGLGGLDIYKTINANGTWSPPENMDYPINSTHDDFGFMPDSESAVTGYFSSNRDNDKGMDHIFTFVKKEYVFIVDGMAVEKDSDKPLPGVTVALTNKLTGNRDSVTTADDGTFSFRLAPEAEFSIVGTKHHFFTQSTDVSTVDKHASENMLVHLRMEVEPVVVEKVYTIPNIYYDYDKADIRSDAAVQLDSLAGILEANPTIKIELMSHTDCRGTSEYNMKLSQKRADAAVKYLTHKGIDKTRMTAQGYGETKLTNQCSDGVACSEAEHQANRRTEFKVTGFVNEKM
jgi:peptidoglycan-associated lipoprotein